MKKRGTFIVFDGPEGAGKSTQVSRMKEVFADKVVVTREPGGSPYAEEIRSLILGSEHAGGANAEAMFALFWAARADHLQHTILPALNEGYTVISDRFDSTTFGYQLYGQGARHLEDLFWVMRDHYLGDNEPDMYIFFDIEPRVALQRKIVNNEEMNHFDEREIAFHQRVREGFSVFKEKTPSVTIDGSGAIEEVEQHLLDTLATFNIN